MELLAFDPSQVYPTERNLRLDLPPGWQNSRHERHIVTVDSADTALREDGLSISQAVDGSPILHVSVADIGSFMLDNPDVRRAVRFSRITPQLFSLDEGRRNPAITLHLPLQGDIIDQAEISQEVVTCKNVTWDVLNAVDVELISEDRDTLVTLHGLQARLRKLVRTSTPHRLAKPARGNYMERSISAAMVLTNTAVAYYMADNNIPGLYVMQSPSNRTSKIYTNEPTAYSASESAMYAYFTSPLRGIAAFVNQCNVAAHLQNESSIYSEDDTQALVHHINGLKAVAGRRREYRAKRAAEVAAKDTAPDATQVLEALTENADSSSVEDLAIAIFQEAKGSSEEVAELSKLAVECIAQDPDLILDVIKYAGTANWLTVCKDGVKKITYAHPTSPNGFSVHYGNSFSYFSAMSFIGDICGYHPHKRVIAANQALLDKIKQFNILEHRNKIHTVSVAESVELANGKQGFGVTVHAFINGELFSASQVKASEKGATRAAIIDILGQTSLLSVGTRRSARKATPRLLAFAQSRGITEPSYEYVEHDEPVKHMECTITFPPSEAGRSLTVKGASKKQAREAASRKMLHLVNGTPIA